MLPLLTREYLEFSMHNAEANEMHENHKKHLVLKPELQKLALLSSKCFDTDKKNIIMQPIQLPM